MRRLQYSIIAAALCAMIGSASAAPPPTLRSAYQKEFAFLEAQKRTLEQRIAAQKKTYDARTKAASAALNKLQAQSLASDSEVRRLEALLQGTEQNVQNVAEQKVAINELLRRAGDEAKLTLPESKASATKDAQVAAMFGAAAKRLFALSSVRRRPGSFFDRRGTEVKGEILHVGGIAAYGIAGATAGPLIPSGSGNYKIWPASTAKDGQVVRALAAGQVPAELPIVLFEPRGKNVAYKAPDSWRDTVNKGGLIGWVIVGLGLLAALLVVLRSVTLLLASRGRNLLSKLSDLFVSRDIRQLKQALESKRGPRARVLKAITGALPAAGRDELEAVGTEAVLREAPSFERFGSWLSVIAAVSPLLGLLGTVTGIIATFDVITTHGTGDPKLLSAGISEALITTELGLLVAIPTLLLANLLKGRATRGSASLEHDALRAINLVGGNVAEPDTPSDGQREVLPGQLVEAS